MKSFFNKYTLISVKKLQCYKRNKILEGILLSRNKQPQGDDREEDTLKFCIRVQ